MDTSKRISDKESDYINFPKTMLVLVNLNAKYEAKLRKERYAREDAAKRVKEEADRKRQALQRAAGINGRISGKSIRA